MGVCFDGAKVSLVRETIAAISEVLVKHGVSLESQRVAVLVEMGICMREFQPFEFAFQAEGGDWIEVRFNQFASTAYEVHMSNRTSPLKTGDLDLACREAVLAASEGEF